MDFMERFERLEASHVKLMTEHELAVQENDKAWERNQKSWDRHEKWLQEYDTRCERDRVARVELDERISELVSGIGEFIRQQTK